MNLIDMPCTGGSAQLLSHAKCSRAGMACYQNTQSKTLQLISCTMSAMLRVAAVEKASCKQSFIAYDELSHIDLKAPVLPTSLEPSIHGNTMRVRAYLTLLTKTLVKLASLVSDVSICYLQRGLICPLIQFKYAVFFNNLKL